MNPQVLIDDQRIHLWFARHQLTAGERQDVADAVRDHVRSDVNPQPCVRDTVLDSVGWCSMNVAHREIRRDDGSTLKFAIAYRRLDLPTGDPILIRLNYARTV